MTPPVLSNSRTLVDRITIPRRRAYDDPIRFGSGVDFGSDGIALVQMTDGAGQIVKVLVWFAGCKSAVCGIRGFGHEYVPARLKISWNKGFDGKCLHRDGGRLSPALLRRHLSVIDEHFGAGTTEQIDIGKTLVIADG